MPGEEICGAMNGQGLIDVYSNEVIVSVLATRAERPRLRRRIE
jgi:hypothetical protein